MTHSEPTINAKKKNEVDHVEPICDACDGTGMLLDWVEDEEVDCTECKPSKRKRP